MKINPKKYYSGPEAQKILGIKSRQYIPRYVEDNLLEAIKSGKKGATRYLFLGAWLQDFLDKEKMGLVKKKYFK